MTKFFFTCLILTAVLFTYTVDAQELGLMRKAVNITIAAKTQYPLGDPLPAGTYSIGSGGYFPTIDSAFNKLSTDGVAGNVTLELIDDLYTAMGVQYGFILIGPIPGAGADIRVTIRPAANKNVTIQGNNESLLLFLNTSYLTMDGINTSGPTTMTIHTLSDTAQLWNDGVEFINDCDHNIVQNIIFIQDDITRNSSSVVFIGTGSDLPDSNLVQNNFVKKSGSDIGFMGSSLTTMCKGNVVKGNRIGSESDSLISWGVFLILCENTLVENNIIQNINTSIPGETITPGIIIASCYNTITRNNLIYNISTEEMNIAAGIILWGVYGNGVNNVIYNNMIYNVNSTSTRSSSRVAGIHLWRETNPKVYYNTVYLSGTGASKLGSAALYLYDRVTNADIKNNILVNTRDESTYCAAAIYNYYPSAFLSDNNDLYYDSNDLDNCLVRIGSTNYYTLAEWQATGKDLNSYVEMPHFMSPTDLHIDETIATYLESRGTPIEGIDLDFDGNTRNATTPDIGADEFNGIVVGVNEEETLPTEYALEQNYPNPFNPSTKISWQSPVGGHQTIKVFDVLGNEIATLVDDYKPAGRYEIEFDGGKLVSGVYFYQLKSGDYISVKKMIFIK